MYHLSKFSPRGDALVAAATTPNSATQHRLRLRLGSANVPHPAKVDYGGEDAHFTSDVGGGALGVADGVGGWHESGVNPAEYSAMFMEVACSYLEGRLAPPGDVAETPGGSSSSSSSSGSALEGGWAGGEEAGSGNLTSGEWMGAPPTSAHAPCGVDFDSASDADNGSAAMEARRSPGGASALGALEAAHRLTRKPGSATACVLRLDPESGELEAANLGDSGFILIRGGAVAFHSPPLQHFFDCPFQFGATPEHTEATDSVDDAEVYRLPLLPGDIIVLATDGLLDNMHRHEVVEVAGGAAVDVGATAAELARRAAENAADPEFESPYAAQAAAQGLELPFWEKVVKAKISFGEGSAAPALPSSFQAFAQSVREGVALPDFKQLAQSVKVELGQLKGGKLDDVTVVVAYVEAIAVEVPSAELQ